MADQRARVDTLDTDHARLFQVLSKRHLRAPVRRPLPVFLDDETLDVHAPRLRVLGVDSDVADFRISHADQLALVRRVGQHFLVAGHRGVEDRLAHGLAHRAKCAAAENSPVGQRQYRFAPFAHRSATPSSRRKRFRPPTIVSTALPFSRIPANGVLRLFDRNFSGATVHSRLGSITVMSAARANRKRTCLQPQQRRGIERHHLNQARRFDQRSMHQLERKSERGLETHDSVRRVRE